MFYMFRGKFDYDALALNSTRNLLLYSIVFLDYIAFLKGQFPLVYLFFVEWVFASAILILNAKYDVNIF